MFGLINKGKDKIVKKSITRKYKNAKITIMDANYKKDNGNDKLLDENSINRLFNEINKACESSGSKYNPNIKRILVANDTSIIDNLLKKEHNDELQQIDFKEEFMDVYIPKYTMDQVYLCENEKQQIMTVLNSRKYEEKLYKEWGFDEISIRNRAAIFNFYGVPGTGKSMAAEAIGSYLDKKIYSINYANLESKYVGQTPKNIKKAFERAKQEDAILVFEEADSFLGKRLTSISQSADYGVNITRSVMLLELEKFDGIVIFTTNLMGNYDEAFKRRILASVEFKMPDEVGRIKIFETHIPNKLPLSKEINAQILAKEFTDVSGADIKDVVFMAAVIALEKSEKRNDEEKKEESPIEDNNIINILDKIVINAEKELQEEEASIDSECKDVDFKNGIDENNGMVEITLEDFRESYDIIKNRYKK